MRKIILFNMISLDGFFAGPNGEIDWHNVDAEFNEFAIEQLGTIDTIIFGRVTYEGMASYWPTPQALADDQQVARLMNAISKIVFSKTLTRADWNNTRLMKKLDPVEINRLKQQPGKDIFIFGSGDLAAGFIQHGLIDEYRLMVNPVVLGSGMPMFKGLKNRLRLKLIKERAFKSGNVLLYYAPD
jgi:dihydrofolate reductase